jgi:hypothetical protein
MVVVSCRPSLFFSNDFMRPNLICKTERVPMSLMTHI